LPTAVNANIIVPTAPNRTPSHGFAPERSLQTGDAVRYRELRRILQLIVVAGLPATAAGCVGPVIDTDCVNTVDDTFSIQFPTDPPLQFDINACMIDVDACTALCQEVMRRENVMELPTRCEVDFSDTGIEIDVSYEVFTGGSDCSTDDMPIPEDFFAIAPDEAARSRIEDSFWNGGRTCHA
jgi:hypothetical protein